jgi:hypothetical protein
MTAAAYHDMAPGLCKWARQLPETMINNLCGIAAVFGVEARRAATGGAAFPEALEKDAHEHEGGLDLASLLTLLLMQNRHEGGEKGSENESAPTQMAAGNNVAPSSDSDEGEDTPQVVAKDRGAQHFEAEHKDQIDHVLSGEQAA